MIIRVLVCFLAICKITQAVGQPSSQGTIPNTPLLNITAPPVSDQSNKKSDQSHNNRRLMDSATSSERQFPQNKPKFPLTDTIEPLPSKSNERILTQSQPSPPSQPSKVIQGQVNGQQVHYQKSVGEQIIQLEVYKVNSVDLNYQHIKTYSFQLSYSTQFNLKVEQDTEIKGTFMIYWQQDGSYTQSSYDLAQEVHFNIFQNHQSLVFHENCYHTMGFKFLAKKGQLYSLVFISQGHKKLVSMVMENYMTHRAGSQKLVSDHVSAHQLETEKIKNTLRTYYSVVERNFMMNQQIAYNVTLHSKRYMSYQIIEMVLVILGACIQIYLIKKLLNPQGIV